MTNSNLNDDDKAALTCDGCPGHCCSYLAVEIDEPEDEEDYDTIRWYIAHDTWIFFEDDGWYLFIRNKCNYLMADKRCQIYESRMSICKEHSNKECERWEEWNPDLLFKTVEEWEVYADRQLLKSAKKVAKRKGKKRKKHRKMRWLIDNKQ